MTRRRLPRALLSSLLAACTSLFAPSCTTATSSAELTADAAASDAATAATGAGSAAAPAAAPAGGTSTPAAGACTSCGDAGCVRLESDRNNCGACGHACDGSEGCGGGTCVAKLDWAEVGLSQRRLLAADAEGAYWLTQVAQGYELRGVSHTETTPRTIAPVPTIGKFPHDDVALTVAGDEILLVGESATGTAVYRVEKAGGTFALLASNTDGPPNGNQVVSVAAGGGYAFWVGGKGIYRVSLAGGGPQLWTKTLCAEHLRVANGQVYWSCSDNDVARRPISAPVELEYRFSHYKAGETYDLDATNMYYFKAPVLGEKTGNISALALDGTTGMPWIKTGARGLHPIAVNGGHVYWSEFLEHAQTLFAAPLEPGATGKPIVELDSSDDIWEIAIGGPWVYLNTGAIYRFPRIATNQR